MCMKKAPLWLRSLPGLKYRLTLAAAPAVAPVAAPAVAPAAAAPAVAPAATSP